MLDQSYYEKADEIIAYLIETNLLSFFADNIETLLWEGFIMAKDEKKNNDKIRKR